MYVARSSIYIKIITRKLWIIIVEAFKTIEIEKMFINECIY